MSFRNGNGAPDLARSIEQPAAIHVVADHDSLRRSLIALLKAWGAAPVAFKKGRGFLRSRRRGEEPPACMIVDTDGLDRNLASFLDDLRRGDPARPVLILHGSEQRLQRDLATIDQRNIESLLKPYQIGELYAAVQALLADRR